MQLKKRASKTPKELNQEIKIDQIRHGFVKVFMRDGYAGASVDDISREAKTSKATMYKYFPDKSYMFIDMLEITMAQAFSGKAFKRLLDEPPKVVLAKILYDLAEWSTSEPRPSLLRLVVSEVERFPQGAQDYASGIARNVTEPLKSIIDKWIVAGEIRHHNIDDSAFQLSTLVMAQAQYPIMLGLERFDNAQLVRISNEAAELFLSRYEI